MRHRANRLLRVLLSAPVAVLLAVSSAPVVHALGPAADDSQPRPYVIAIDAGHGGASDNSHPDRLFDPGAIGVNGLLEKDVTLDIAKQLQTLLLADHVTVVMTRTDDRYIGIQTRSRIANDAHADLFVSVHQNSFTDGSAGGSLVLYPTTASQRLAQALSDSLGGGLVNSGIGNGGIQLRSDWWIHLAMPAATVEGAYLSNPREAALLATNAFRHRLAVAIHDGLIAYDPAIPQRGAAVAAWERAHRQSSGPAPATRGGATMTTPAGRSPSLITILILLGLAAAAVRWRRQVLIGIRLVHRVLVVVCPLVWRWSRGTVRFVGRRAAARRRRHVVRERAEARRSERYARPHSVYDELWF